MLGAWCLSSCPRLPGTDSQPPAPSAQGLHLPPAPSPCPRATIAAAPYLVWQVGVSAGRSVFPLYPPPLRGVAAGKEGSGWNMCATVSWAKAKKRSSLTRLAAPWCVWRVIQWGPLVHLQSRCQGHPSAVEVATLSPVYHQDAVLWKGD